MHQHKGTFLLKQVGKERKASRKVWKHAHLLPFYTWMLPLSTSGCPEWLHPDVRNSYFLPINLLNTFALKESIRLAEVFAAEETMVSRAWRRMHGCQHQVFMGVDKGDLLFCITSPQHEYQILTSIAQFLYHCICKSFPPIQKKTTGFYHLLQFEAEGALVDKLETAYRRDERVIRLLTFRLDKYAYEYTLKRRSKYAAKQEEK